MKNVHPIELMLAAALVVAEAVLILVIAAAALFHRREPSRIPCQLPPARPPAPPVGSQLLAHLEGLTCAQLRAIAGTTRRLRKAELVALVAAMPI